ncbi:MAG: ergothioneine biosynthesis protein EgtB [Nitrosopumilus sp.]|nr:ergothioneine biosynthesis protein EgtB [Nitrosopumilus sp.]
MSSTLLLNDIVNDFIEVRDKTMDLFSPLDVEDAVVQSSNFGSPPNWHIAHVTWFFHKILEKYHNEIVFENNFNLNYLNSYYHKYGKILTKSERGKYPRPTVTQSIKYRKEIEKCFIEFLKSLNKKEFSDKLILDIFTAINHEMQHQELMIYDFQHYFNRFPDERDNYCPAKRTKKLSVKEKISKEMVEIPGGIYELGYNGKGFCYDNELPENKIYLNPYKIDNNLVTNEQFIHFIEDDGYKNYKYWLADGWELVSEENWNCPLYWYFDENKRKWFKKDFRGINEIVNDEPVVNVSYYEADAFAKWTKKRLPTESEWEKAASWDEKNKLKTFFPWGNEIPTKDHANLFESHLWSPSIAGSFPAGKSHYGCHQMIGDVWEWTSSEYMLYPGFKSRFEEYTDKWAINQKVLRGGSFATSVKQIRSSYRNYFKPQERILFAGFRCVKDSIF